MPERRRLRNDRLRQEVNARIADLAAELQSLTDSFEFLCECNRPDCRETFRLTADDYRRLGAAERLLIVPSHYNGPTDDVVATSHDLYAVSRERSAARST